MTRIVPPRGRDWGGRRNEESLPCALTQNYEWLQSVVPDGVQVILVCGLFGSNVKADLLPQSRPPVRQHTASDLFHAPLRAAAHEYSSRRSVLLAVSYIRVHHPARPDAQSVNSVAIKSLILFAAKPDAIRIAFLMAFELDRPWQMMQTP